MLCLNCLQFVTFASAHQAWHQTLYSYLNDVVSQSTLLVLAKPYTRAYSL